MKHIGFFAQKFSRNISKYGHGYERAKNLSPAARRNHISILYEKGDLTSALEQIAVLRTQVEQLPIIVYNMLLGIYHKTNSEAFRTTLQEMEDIKIEYSLITYNTILMFYSQQKEGLEMIKLYKSMKNGPIKPNVETLHIMLSFFKHQDDMVGILIADMGKFGIRANSYIFNVILETMFLKKVPWDDIRESIKVMEDPKAGFNSVSYSIVMNGLFDYPVQTLQDFLKDEKFKKYRAPPPFGLLIVMYTRNNKLEELTALWLEMKNDPKVIDEQNYCNFINGFLKFEKFEQILDLVEHISQNKPKKNIFLMNILTKAISVMATAGKYDTITKIVEILMNRVPYLIDKERILGLGSERRYKLEKLHSLMGSTINLDDIAKK